MFALVSGSVTYSFTSLHEMERNGFLMERTLLQIGGGLMKRKFFQGQLAAIPSELRNLDGLLAMAFPRGMDQLRPENMARYLMAQHVHHIVWDYG